MGMPVVGSRLATLTLENCKWMIPPSATRLTLARLPPEMKKILVMLPLGNC